MSSEWFCCHVRRQQVVSRLFCFPHAGGAASVFFRWPRTLSDTIEVHAAQLPGREHRRGEELTSDWDHVVESLTNAAYEMSDLPFALYGHSLGAVLAFEVAHRLHQRGVHPAHLFVAGRRAPHLPMQDSIANMTKTQFLDRLQRDYGALPEAILADPKLLDLFYPIIHSDIRLLENYDYRARPPLPCPITVFGGTADKSTTPAMLDAWREHTAAPFERLMFASGHFFTQTSLPELISELEARLSD